MKEETMRNNMRQLEFIFEHPKPLHVLLKVRGQLQYAAACTTYVNSFFQIKNIILTVHYHHSKIFFKKLNDIVLKLFFKSNQFLIGSRVDRVNSHPI